MNTEINSSYKPETPDFSEDVETAEKKNKTEDIPTEKPAKAPKEPKNPQEKKVNEVGAGEINNFPPAIAMFSLKKWNFTKEKEGEKKDPMYRYVLQDVKSAKSLDELASIEKRIEEGRQNEVNPLEKKDIDQQLEDIDIERQNAA